MKKQTKKEPISISQANNLDTSINLNNKEKNKGDISIDERIDIVSQISACLAVMRTFGMEKEDIETVCNIFIRDLIDDFSPNQIIKAFIKWRKTEQIFPTPSDIRKIITNPFEFDRSVYIRLSEKAKKDPYHTKIHEHEYIKAYENKHLMEFKNSEYYKKQIPQKVNA